MRIAITGATGLLGRNLLFEILKQYVNKLNEIEVVVFGRSGKYSSFSKRVLDILQNDGLDYIGVEEQQKKHFLQELEKRIINIEFDLKNDDLGIDNSSLKLLKSKKIDYFFHLAAMSDFRKTPNTREKLYNINVDGTNRILKMVKSLDVGLFIYTGTAFSFGSCKNVIDPDYVNKRESFNNYYEETKLLAEASVREEVEKSKINYLIFRPVSICGRLIERPYGKTTKYDIFYGWANFFFRIKLDLIKNLDNVYSTKVDMPIRIACKLSSTMNVIPADYAAKIMLNACFNKHNNMSIHLMNDSEISNNLFTQIILEKVGVTGITFCSAIPEKMDNDLEKLYYKTVGEIYSPYLLSDNIRFDSSSLNLVREHSEITAPKIDKSNFTVLLQYAMDDYFGIKRKQNFKEA